MKGHWGSKCCHHTLLYGSRRLKATWRLHMISIHATRAGIPKGIRVICNERLDGHRALPTLLTYNLPPGQVSHRVCGASYNSGYALNSCSPCHSQAKAGEMEHAVPLLWVIQRGYIESNPALFHN